MKLPELSEIERLRKNVKMTQTELSKKAKVSQSIIARIESNSVDPRYSKVKKIFNALSEIEEEKGIRAKDIMCKNVTGVSVHEIIETAVKIMRRKAISQLPVFDGDKIVGTISEQIILNKIAEGESGENVSLAQVKNVMEEAFPTIDKETPIEIISSMLEYSPAIIVTEKGKGVGIITKSDFLKVIHR